MIMDNNIKKGICYCCHQEKDGTEIPITIIKNDVIPMLLHTNRFVCHSCNHLKSENDRPSLQGEPDSIKLGEK